MVSWIEGPSKFKREYTMQIFFYRENKKKKREVGREEEMKKIYTYILPERVLVRD